MFATLLAIVSVAGLSASPGPIDPRCPECRASIPAIEQALQDLHSSRWRQRDEAARKLAEIRWQCHPEVVAALAEALHSDGKAKVRAEVAESLGRMVPNLPQSHVALTDAARGDAEASVRKQAARALAAKGLRCVVDCPICGPLPRGAAITGPSLVLPEWNRRQEPVKQDSAAAKASTLLPALPEPTPRP